MTIEDHVQQICDAITADTATPESLADALGATAVRAEPPQPILLVARGGLSGIAEARLVLRPDGEPSHVELELDKSAALTLGALRTRFGDFRAAPQLHFNRPIQVLFYPSPPQQRIRCAVIASVPPAATPSDDTPVSAVSVRRDR
jgi:hypothetical protein